MNKIIFVLTSIIVLSTWIFTSDSFCAGEKAPDKPKIAAPKADTPNAKPSKKEMTRDEMLAELKDSFDEADELFNMIHGLKAETDKNGKVYYMIGGVKLEDMENEDLSNLLIKVRQVLVKIRTERIQNQLETVERIHNLQRVVVPSQAPAAPATPRSAPRTPQAPPSPPRRY